MKTYRKTIVVGLMVCVLPLSLGDVSVLPGAETSPRADAVRQQLGLLGVGAEVKVNLADGKRLRGAVQDIQDAGFLLAGKRQSSTARIAYDQVAQLRPAKLTYRAHGQQDPLEARRAVVGLGVGKHIMVKTTGGQEYHGNIQAIDPNHFAMLPDLQPAQVQIPYAEVVAIGPNLTTTSKIAIAVVVGLAIVVTVFLISQRNKIGY